MLVDKLGKLRTVVLEVISALYAGKVLFVRERLLVLLVLRVAEKALTTVCVVVSETVLAITFILFGKELVVIGRVKLSLAIAIV